MNKKFNLSALLLFAALIAFGQKESFKVVINKGNNEVKNGSKWSPLKPGSSLQASDELRVAENSYVGLMHASGKPVEVKIAGTYTFKQLSDKVPQGTSVLAKYTDFILSSNDPKTSKMAATGAVHRGAKKIKVYLPAQEHAVVYSNIVTIDWDTQETSAPYTVTFNSMFGDELTKFETKDDFVTIDLNEVTFANEDNILVRVTSKTGALKESDEYTIKRLSRADINRIKNSYNEIQSYVSEETAMSKLALAGFFEENNLLIDAGTAYLDAIKLAPDVPMYKEYYDSFLLRHNIKELPPKK